MTWHDLLREATGRLCETVLPTVCGACGSSAAEWHTGWCRRCWARLRHIPAVLVRDLPTRAPPCLAAGAYRGPLRTSLLAYKERGRRDLAKGLGRLLAARLEALEWPPMWLVPVPATARARRARGYDQVPVLCQQLVRWLPQARVVPLLHAAPRPDSTGLNATARLAAASASLYARRRARTPSALPGGVLLVDDIITTGATLASAAVALRTVGVECRGALALAATPRRTKAHVAGGNSSVLGRDIAAGRS